MDNRLLWIRPVHRRGQLLRFAPWVYIFGAAAMVPWIIYLGLTLPMHYETAHYRGTWVIFDAGLAISLAFVGYFVKKRDARVIVAASVAATLLFADSWFDVSSAHGSDDHLQALMLALFLEIPGGIVCLRLARRALRRLLQTGTLEPEHERTPEHSDDEGLTSTR